MEVDFTCESCLFQVLIDAEGRNMDITAIRKEFPVTGQLIYFNHAAVAPLPLRSARRARRFLMDSVSYGSFHYQQWKESLKRTPSFLTGS